MSVVIETTLGDMTVDLFLAERPIACLNFLKLCKIKYYNYNLFHTISRGFIAQTGDPTGSRKGGESIYGVLDGEKKRYFEGENEPRLKHTKMGLISFVGNEERMIGSQFFLTLGEDLTYLDLKHCVFGEIVEGLDILEVINEVICDTDDRPYQDVRITHTVILDDPYPDPKRLKVPSRSPSPSTERLQGGRIAPDEEIDETEDKTVEEIMELQAEREAKARANILEMVGDLPDADMAPPENVLFVCKLNPVTSDDDLEIIFNRFGKILSCEVIRDKKTGDSLQYAFIEFEDQKACEDAYFKMDNILIDDRRIHVDFSQSVSKVKWLGKGRGVRHYDEKGKITSQGTNEIGKGNYKTKSRDQNRDLSPPSTNDSRTTKKYSQKNDFNRTDSNRIREDVRPRSPRRNHDYDLDTQSNRNSRQHREYSPYRNKDDSRRDKRHWSVSRSPVRHRIDDRRYRESYGSRGRYNDRVRRTYDERDRSRYDERDRSRYDDRNRSKYDDRDRSRYESRNYDLMRQTSRYERNGLSSSRYSEKQERSHTYRTSTKSHYDYSKRNSFVNEDDSKYSKKEKDISIKNKKTDTESSSDENKKQSQNKTADRKNRTKTTASKKKKKVSSSDSESSSDSDSTSSSSSSDTEEDRKSKKNKNKRKNKFRDISSSEDKSHGKGKNKKKKKKPETESSSSETDSDSSKSESSESEDEKQSRKRLKKGTKVRSDHSDEEIKKNKKKSRKRD